MVKKEKKIVIFKSPIFMNSIEVSFKEESFDTHTHTKVYQKNKPIPSVLCRDKFQYVFE